MYKNNIYYLEHQHDVDVKKTKRQQKDLGYKVENIEWNEHNHTKNICQLKQGVRILKMIAIIVIEVDE